MSLPHLDLGAEAVAHLALQRLRVGLAGLDAAAGELPQEREDRGRAPLRDEVAARRVSRTAATTRIVRSWLIVVADRARARRASHRHAEELLPHEQDVARARRRSPRARRTKVPFELPRSVEHEPAALPREPAVQAGDVAVLGEEDVAALASEVDAALGDRERVARHVAADDERDAADVALRRACRGARRRRAPAGCGVSGSKRMISCPMRKMSFGWSSTGTSRASFL